MTRIPVRTIAGERGVLAAVEQGAVAVIVDALRASATLAALLHAGAREILVTAEVETARRVAMENSGSVLVGERGGRKLPDFDYGNSPTEILAHDLRGATAVFTSSNAAGRLVGAATAAAVLAGSTVNASAAARAAAGIARGLAAGIIIVPVGSASRDFGVAFEDYVAAHMIASQLAALGAELLTDPDEAWPEGRPARTDDWSDYPNGIKLAGLGYAADVEFCARVDVLGEVPRGAGVRRTGWGGEVLAMA